MEIVISMIKWFSRNEPISYPSKQMIRLESQAVVVGEVDVALSISWWQWGHTMWVDWAPRGTTVVRMVVGAPVMRKGLVNFCWVFALLLHFQKSWHSTWKIQSQEFILFSIIGYI